MESLTYLKNIKITPKKLRFLVDSVKKHTPSVALVYLNYMPNKSARVLYKAVQSAVSNAKHTLKVNDDLLQFKVLTIEEGQKLKRFEAGSRGMAKPFVRRYSHIKIILTASAAQLTKAVAKDEPKKDEKRAEKAEQVWEAEADAAVEMPKKEAKKPAAKKTVKKAEPKKKVTNKAKK